MRDLDALVARHTFHALGERTRELVVQIIPQVAGREVELRLVVIVGGVDPALFLLCALRQIEPGLIPGIEVCQAWRDRASLFKALLGFPVGYSAIERIIHARIRDEMEIHRHPPVDGAYSDVGLELAG